MEPILVELTTNTGKKLFKEYHTSDFSKLVNPKRVNAFALDENNRVLLVKTRNNVWTPPGGKIEFGESPEQALVRELFEEAAVKITLESITPLLYSEAYVDEPIGEWKFIGLSLRYMCRISEKQPFISDVGNDIVDQVYCEIDEVTKYANLGKTGEMILAELKRFSSLKN